MRYLSTRDNHTSLPAAGAIAQGLSRDGGLFVPETFPALTPEMLEKLAGMTYQQRAAWVMGRYLSDYTPEELTVFSESAYSHKTYDHPEIAPVRRYSGETSFLELWHGPTCAFKDMALQILPHLLSAALDKTEETRDACILVATSGDTGKAALEGFRDVARTKIMVFYPRDGVSDVQKLQMTTQAGENVGVCSVVGNFDDAQTGVKAIFSDEALRAELDGRGYFLSSANSINWGRLLPQIVYYISAYCDLVNAETIKMGDEVNFCVPTGNFGNILAGYYAKRMGLPVARLICASNRNDVLTEFVQTGVYDRNRTFYTTISPSMDILVSSNLERLLYELSGKDDALIASYMDALGRDGRYEVSGRIKDALAAVFSAGCCDDDETKAIIRDTFRRDRYLMDTHTAVAYGVLEKYRAATGDLRHTVVVSTANPYKFCDSVIEALGETAGGDGFSLLEKMHELTGAPMPAPLAGLKGRAVRFTDCVEKEDMLKTVRDFLA